MATIKDITRTHKTFIYEIYTKIFGLPYDIFSEDYDKLTRKKMVNEIYDLYRYDYKIIYYALNDNDLNIVDLIYQNKYNHKMFMDNEYISHYNDLLILDCLYYSIADEIKDTVKLALDEYKKNKDKIEKEKEKLYLIVGLIRSYGVLKYNELEYLFKLYFNETIDEYINSLYVSLNSYYYDNKYFISEDLINYEDDILKTHSKEFKTLYDYDYLITRGKYFYDINSDAYKLVKNNNQLLFLINHNDSISLYKGFNNVDGFLKNDKFLFDYYLKNQEDLDIFLNFVNSLPVFLLNDYSNKNVIKEVSDLFYSFITDLIKYSAKELKMELKLDTLGHVDSNDSFNIFKELINNTNIIDKFIFDNNLNDNQIEMLKALKRGKFGMFIAYKDLNDGTIFIDNDKLYLVKGLLTPIKDIIYYMPVIVETVIFPYNGYILTNGIILEQPIKLGKNISKQLKELYNKNKDKIIKSY